MTIFDLMSTQELIAYWKTLTADPSLQFSVVDLSKVDATVHYNG